VRRVEVAMKRVRISRNRPPKDCKDLDLWLSGTIGDAMRDAREAGLNSRSVAAIALSHARSAAMLACMTNGAVLQLVGLAGAEPPTPMLLWCPGCTERHIDEGEFETKPHHTHACQNCGHVWRPALVPTVGVRFLPGFKNKVSDPVDSASSGGET
jgi:hypothetical protein